MADKEPIRWITVSGKHIPIYEGETNADALDRAFGKKSVKVGDKDVSVADKKPAGKVGEAFDYAKGKIDKESYSWKETVMDVEYEYKLTPQETKELEVRMKLYAMTHDKFKGMHEQWEKDFKKQGFDYKRAMQMKKGFTETHKPEELLDDEHALNKAEYGRPVFEEAFGEYPGFKTDKANVPFYDRLLEEGKATIVEMTPEQYLHEIAYYVFDKTDYRQSLRGAIDDEVTLKYAKMMRNGVKFDTPYLSYDNEAQEGRHRAIAAFMNGIDKIPVIVVGRRR